MSGARPRPDRSSTRLRQIAWFVALWIASLVVVSAVAYAIRAVLL